MLESSTDTVHAVSSLGLAYSLAYEPGRLVAIDQIVALLARLSNDPRAIADPGLAHAIKFAASATSIERKVAVEKVQPIVERAIASGWQVPPLPSDIDGWLRWRSVVESVASSVDPQGMDAVQLGQYGFELIRAWSYAASLAYLRASHTDHPLLQQEIRQVSSDVTSAWHAFDEAIKDMKRPLLEKRRKDLADWMKYAPSPEAVDSAEWGERGASAEIRRWNETLDLIAKNVAKDLDAPIDPAPSAPPTTEEKHLFAAIIANPDDDQLRLRFAELAARRVDPRAELIRDQFEILRGGSDQPYDRVRQRIGSHPEWSAPLLALGATEVKFERGFPSEITIDVDSFLANAAELFAQAPITTVRLRGGLGGKGAHLASVPQLAQLHTLDLSGQGVTDADVIALVQSGHLGKLWELILHQNPVTSVGVDAIAAATHAMPELTCVNLQITRAVDPCDRFEHYNETQGEYVPTPEGKALEAKYGRLPWLHAEQTVLSIPVPRQRR